MRSRGASVLSPECLTRMRARALLLALVLPCVAWQAALAAKKRARPRREVTPSTGPTTDMIWDSGLLERTLPAATLVERGQQYYHDVSIKRFPGPVLGYVTPWNRKGYDLAVLFRAKLTHVSPVWYQIKRKDGAWLLEGGHEYNETWVNEVRQPGGKEGAAVTRVVPRVIVELDSAEHHIEFVRAPREAAALILDEVKAKEYDGIVLEVYMTWAHMNAMSNDAFVEAVDGLLRGLSAAFQVMGRTARGARELILAVPPPVPQSYSRPYIMKQHLKRFSQHVAFWSMMTYDYAMNSGPQPNSPLPWLEQQFKVIFGPDDGGPGLEEPQQALMGMNFYGYSFALKDAEGRQEAVVGSDVLTILSKQQPTLEWDDEDAEHSFEYRALNGLQRVYYPTPRSIEMRVELFKKHGVGISIWELGQGLESFFDLL